jgi:septation ring formation regulator EzrA
MATQVPQTVRRAWGDEVVTEFVPWLEQVIEEKTFPRLKQLVEEKAVPRDEYRQVLSRLDVLEHDVTDIKADVRELRTEMNERFDRVNERFDRVNERFVDMERHFETRFDQINDRFDQINDRFEVRLDQMSERMLVQTRWLIGSIVLFGTILTILQAIAQFTP